MIEVVSGSLSKGKDWNRVWLDSTEHQKMVAELDGIISEAAAKAPGTFDDGFAFAAPMWEQVKVVSHRMNVSLYRNTEYVNNKFILHVILALLNGFTFYQIADDLGGLQLKLFTVFSFIFVAPGLISQLQPLFIDRRDIYETREKKSKTYHWVPFVTGLIVSELPYLVICAVLYFVSWYFTTGLPTAPKYAGSTFFVVVSFPCPLFVSHVANPSMQLVYECLYTGIGQLIAAYAPNAVFASLVNPLVITTLVSFCGVMVPYSQIEPFWRYWIYYLDPYNYLMSALLIFGSWSTPVTCRRSELAIFDPPAGTSCGQYLAAYQQGVGVGTNLLNPQAMSGCEVCQYDSAASYIKTLNLGEEYYGWRNAGIVVLFAFGCYGLVYLMMKLRTKATKKAGA
jgi:ATP-binding cassette subfamily G (WHITE) protein 2 (SNQ2)